MRVLEMNNVQRPVVGDLKASAKWTCILAIPAVLVVLGVSVMLGGIHGHGQLPLTIAYAPIIALQTVAHVDLSGGPLTWVVTIIIEWLYLFLAVTVFRTVWNILDR